jgi:hypothetical protein
MSAKAAPIDAARVKLLLGHLRLPAIALAWPDLAATADRAPTAIAATIMNPAAIVSSHPD